MVKYSQIEEALWSIDESAKTWNTEIILFVMVNSIQEVICYTNLVVHQYLSQNMLSKTESLINILDGIIIMINDRSCWILSLRGNDVLSSKESFRQE